MIEKALLCKTLKGRLMIAIALQVASTPAWAYLDPGAASLFIQGIIGAIVAAVATFRLWWHRVKALISRKKPESHSKN